ncbi:hypothetical protein GGI02_002696 [Coemansia sp. RSA 2322]|nr:hypothetical protein GGI02_002696 [Coemansia sp. RSA 2322]
MSVPVFEVRFPSYTSGGPPRCTPKSTLAGVVYLQLYTQVQASCLSVNFVGTERISLAPPSANGCDRPATAKQRSVKKVYFNQSAVLWGDPKLRATDWLASGVHMFHFSCEFPRVNYPQTKATPEYEIKYVLHAKLLGPRVQSACSPVLALASQPVLFVPETIAPLLGFDAECSLAARYRFCDNAVDVEEPNHWAFHLQVMGLQQAFSPGDTVDFQLRLTGGQRALRRAQFAVIEQTDCFYPQVPDPHEEQLDLGRRLWSKQRALAQPLDLPFERDSCVMVPDLCPDHMTSKRARGGATYYAHLHTTLPRDLLVMHETGYMRFTYYAELVLYSNSAWGSQVRKAVVRVPIPLATRVLPDANLLLSSAKPTPASLAPSPLLRSRASLAAQANEHSGRRGPPHSSFSSAFCNYSEYAPSGCALRQVYTADSGDSEDLADSEQALIKRGRSIADLGARLQQFIPRKTPPSIYIQGRNIYGEMPPHHRHRSTARAVSHGGFSEPPLSWSVVDLLPPMPEGYGQHGIGGNTSAQSSQASLFSIPLTRTTSLCPGDDVPNCSLAAGMGGVSPLRASRQSNGHHGSGHVQSRSNGGEFSLTFLLRLREFYHDNANRTALDDFVAGHPAANAASVIPSAIIGCGAPPKAKQFGGTNNAMRLNAASNRSSVLSLSGVMAASEHTRPKLCHESQY